MVPGSLKKTDRLAGLLVLNQHVVADLDQPAVRFAALPADHGQVAEDLVEGAVLFHDVDDVMNLGARLSWWRNRKVGTARRTSGRGNKAVVPQHLERVVLQRMLVR